MGQFLYKSGAERAGGSLGSYLLNVRLLGGVLCYVAVMVLFVAAFKKGGALTTLYPVYATTFVFAALIAWWTYGTPIKPANVCGMALLIAGMYFMGR
jgi:multidrug transporter EmrE-like cation transporter